MSRKKPVFEIPESETDAYEYIARYTISRIHQEEVIFLGSDSLMNLKKEVKERGVRIAFLTTRTGAFSYGQNVVDEYPYCPRYR